MADDRINSIVNNKLQCISSTGALSYSSRFFLLQIINPENPVPKKRKAVISVASQGSAEIIVIFPWLDESID